MELKSSIRTIVETEKFAVFDFVEQLRSIVASRSFQIFCTNLIYNSKNFHCVLKKFCYVIPSFLIKC